MANILIVDDSRTSRRILKGILESEGHVVVGEAVDGEQGYAMYAELKPDIVTMDITMPVLDGVASLKKIMESFPDAKVIMISAAGQKHNMVEAVQSGAAEFLTKPFDMEQIKDTIKKVAEA